MTPPYVPSSAPRLPMLGNLWVVDMPLHHSSVSTFKAYFQNFVKSVQSGSFFSNAGASLQNVRNISRTQVAAAGVLLAECLGFFTIGEMIGRMKLIGYHGETHAAAH